MRYVTALGALLIVVSALFVGAYSSGHWGANRLSGVAVVDLDELARQLGVNIALEKQIKDAQASLDQQLQSLQTSLRDQYQQKSQELKTQQQRNGAPSDPAAINQQLAEIEQKLNLQLAQAQQTARKKLSSYRDGLVETFRGKVVPVAREVAAQRGLAVVITKNDTVLLAFDEAHDITNALVEKLRKNQPTTNNQPVSTAAHTDPSASSLR